MSLSDRWTSALEQLRSQGRFREFALPAGIDFTSNDYLGYARHPEAITSSLACSGIASRLLRGHHPIWESVEKRLAAWHGAESALMMSSGYAANEGLISTIIEPGDWVAVDELSHACIVDGLRLARCRRFSFRHNHLEHLEQALMAEAARNEEGRERFIITESLFSMDGDLAPLREIVQLAEKCAAHLIVDEAHSTGCYGQTGAGVIDQLGIRKSVLASVHTGGKGLALPGAYIVSNRLLREYLVNRCRHLIFTTALPPAVGTWWEHRLAQIPADTATRDRLHQNARHFRGQLSNRGVSAAGTEYIVPVIVGEDAAAVRAARSLQQQGFDIRAIRPPSVPPGTSRLRISIHADHDTPTLDRLANAVATAIHHE